MGIRWLQSPRLDSSRSSFRHHPAVARRYCRNPFARHVRGYGQHHVYVSHPYGLPRTLKQLLTVPYYSLGDLIGFEGYLNISTPFDRFEHNALWKSERRYNDFDFGNNELNTCEYPRFYGDDGHEVLNLTQELVGCRDSEFDQYGEIGAFGNYPEWQRQISKFAYVQDRLREWRPDVRAKIEHFACITLGMLDLDGYRMDKGLMLTLDAVGNWSSAMRTCAKALGKENFYISGEVVAGNAFGADYIGRGRTPDNYVHNVTQAVTMTNASENDKYFIRDVGQNAFDGAAFHYTVYRFLSRILGYVDPSAR